MRSREKIVIGTRRTPLALAQARQVQARLQKIYPNREIVLQEFVTQGDKKLSWSLEKTGGKGLFTSELENALLAGTIDVAVHSGKDLPTALLAGTCVAGTLPRAKANDVLVVRAGTPLEKIRKIATGSPRRREQLKIVFPQAEFCEIRGSVETRLRKIADEHLADATVLAAAGLARLGISNFAGTDFHILPLEKCVPAASQALIAMQCRSRDRAIFARAASPAGTHAFLVERAFLSALGEGCHTSFAVHFSRERLLLFRQDLGFVSRKITFPQSLPAIAKKVAKILSELRGNAISADSASAFVSREGPSPEGNSLKANCPSRETNANLKFSRERK